MELSLNAQSIYEDLYKNCGSYRELQELLETLSKKCEEDLQELDNINGITYEWLAYYVNQD